MSIVSSKPDVDAAAVPHIEVLITEARQHRRKRNLITAGVVALVVLAAGTLLVVNRAGTVQGPGFDGQPPPLSGGSASLLKSFEAKSPSLFLSLRGRVTQPEVPPRTFWVVASNTKSGSLARTLLPIMWDGMSVQGISIDHRGGLWVSYAKGPDCRNRPNLASRGPYICGPIANTCRSIVARYNLGTGASTVEYRGSPSEELSGSAASPDGRLLAYLTQGCTTSNGVFPAVRIRDITTGRAWTVQQAATRCGSFSQPTWDFAGRALLFNSYYNTSGCEQTGVWLTKVSALSNGAPSTDKVYAGHGCEYQSVAPLVDGTSYAIEACGGGPSYVSGAVYLVHLDAALRPFDRHLLGKCTDGNGISTSSSGSVLISAYLYCGGAGGPTPTKIWRVVDGRVEAPVTTDGTSWLGEQSLAW